jgi:phage/plasmid-associated DNA primase
MSNIEKQLSEVTKTDPCIHCGKGDWCYRFANGATVCNRENIAQGWEDSGKKDKNRAAILYPVEWAKKQPTPKAVRTTEWIYKDRNGEDLVKVIRQDLDNGKKKIFQNYWNGKRWLQKRPAHVSGIDIPIYNLETVRKAIDAKLPIFIVEGEKCADLLLKMGLIATTNIQGAKSFKPSDLQDLAGADRVILCPDRDTPGVALMKCWESGLKKQGITPEWLYCYPQGNWASIPDDNGLDLFDWVRECDVSEAEIFEAIGQIPDTLTPEFLFGKKVEIKTSTPLKEVSQYDEDDQGETANINSAPESKYPGHVRATEEIYSGGRHISLDGNLYGFNGTHYEKLDQGEETLKFRDWAASNPVYNPKTEKEEYQFMTPAFLEKCWKWVIAEFAIKRDRTNPPGLNLKNGVLRFSFKGRKVSWELSPHSPQDYFLYCSEVEYRPDADPEMAHRLLEALDPDPRMVFLRTVAAGIDLENVRKVLGRGVRAAICRGSGANGKDSLKEAVTLIFDDRQIASATFGDFVSYDQGRKFDLAKLRGVRFNWPSENNQKNTLDLSESMNAAITGDRGLIYERKGKDGEDFTCQAVHLFNCNQLPKMKTGLDSLKTRFCVLDFFKTYKPDPDPSRGELLADPRFKYDRQFMIQEVCPSLLTLILAELPLLLVEGINYDSISDSLEDIQEESTHLWEFCKDYAITPDPNGKAWVHDLWYKLQSFYEENGTLERVDKPDGGFKNVWHEQANKWDANVTGPNQIFKRFKQLFPKIDKRRETKDPEFKGRFYLAGISLNSASPASLSQSSGVFASPSASLSFTKEDSASLIPFPLESEEVKQKVNQNGKNGEAETLAIYSGEAGEAKNGKIPPENLQKILTREEAEQFKGMVTGFKEVLGWDSDKMMDYAKQTLGKSTVGRLTMAEAVLLVESLCKLVENLNQN